MNEMLNTACQASWASNTRAKMKYEHIIDIDSFRSLSPTGLGLLPASIKDRIDRRRPPKLRTSTRQHKDRAPEVVARIVKVGIANLHIYNPHDDYDLRISINVEVNLNHPDLNPLELIEDNDKIPAPDRKKDRVSYKTLAYQLDLTRVDIAGLDRPKYELEVEVDTATLRHQMDLANSQREHAYSHVVSGLLDNAAWLTRQKVPTS